VSDDMSQTSDLQLTGAEPAGDRSDACPEDDRVRRVVQVLLALYLIPAFVVVLAVGAVLLVLLGVLKAVTSAVRVLKGAPRYAEAIPRGLPSRPLGSQSSRSGYRPRDAQVIPSNNGGQTRADFGPRD
jgi:hypothetical protein